MTLVGVHGVKLLLQREDAGGVGVAEQTALVLQLRVVGEDAAGVALCKTALKTAHKRAGVTVATADAANAQCLQAADAEVVRLQLGRLAALAGSHRWRWCH
mgnify:CR=1 FL=1